jgi:cytochrome c oxidase cbb3-type subunit 3
MRAYAPLAIFIGITMVLSACKREQRDFEPDRVDVAKLGPVPLVNLEPGGHTPPKNLQAGKDYEQNAYHLNQGKALFSAMNCNGCHSNGGGGMGPALMDDVWIYGSDFVNIAASIRDGRPNGMPSFGRALPGETLFELAAYVRALGGFVPTNAAPSRNDSLQAAPGENRTQENPEFVPKPPAGNPPAP